MRTEGNFLKWAFNAPEVISAVATAVAITLWSMQTFQSKDEAKEIKAELQAEISSVKSEVSSIREKIDRISGDVQYIRGVLTPKQNQ